MTPPPEEAAASPRLRTELAALGVALAVLAVPGAAMTAMAGARSQGDGGDETPGGPDRPLVLHVGDAFEVDGFDYAAGWSLRADPATGTAQLVDLRLTNHRGEAARLAANVRLVDGYEVAATVFCKAGDGYDYVPVGVSVNVLCESADPVPAAYDLVTIRDAY